MAFENQTYGVTDTSATTPTYAGAAAPEMPNTMVNPSNILFDILGISGAIDKENQRLWDQYNAARQAYEFEYDHWFNANEAEKQRNWEEYMSNTAIVRRMADLKAAGINPLLAMSSSFDASTPSGASANSSGSTTKQVGDVKQTNSAASGIAAIVGAILAVLKFAA